MQAITPNNRENLSTKSDVTGQSEYLLSHNGALDVNMSFPALVTVPFDTITVAYPDTSTEVYTHKSGGTLGAYTVACTPGAGTATVVLHNCTPGSLSEAPVFMFAVIKAVVA